MSFNPEKRLGEQSLGVMILGTCGQKQSSLTEVLSLSHHYQSALPAVPSPGLP